MSFSSRSIEHIVLLLKSSVSDLLMGICLSLHMQSNIVGPVPSTYVKFLSALHTVLPDAKKSDMEGQGRLHKDCTWVAPIWKEVNYLACKPFANQLSNNWRRFFILLCCMCCRLCERSKFNASLLIFLAKILLLQTLAV